MERDSSVSVVLNVYNEEGNIAECLDSLVDQTLEDFELVVVDDGSTDDTMEVVEGYSDVFNLKKVFSSHVGLKKARRKGVESSSGSVVVVVDADEILEPDFLEEIVSPFSNESVGAVGGVLRSYGEGWVVKAVSVLNKLFYRLRQRDGEVDWIQGGCSAYRSKALEEAGGLAREKVSADKDISWRIKESGWKVVLNEDAVAFHHDQVDLFSVMKREYNIGRREFFLLSKHSKKWSWKEISRFTPLLGLFSLICIPVSFFWFKSLLVFFGVFVLLGFLLSFLGLVFFVSKFTDERGLVVFVESWVMVNCMNFSWSVGFLRSFFSG